MFYGQFIDSLYSIEMKNKELNVGLPTSHLDIDMIMQRYTFDEGLFKTIMIGFGVHVLLLQKMEGKFEVVCHLIIIIIKTCIIKLKCI